jgi:hypothetical protein
LTWLVFTGEQLRDNLRTVVLGKAPHEEEKHSESAV